MGAVGAAVAGGVASAAVGSGISALKGSGQSSDISKGQGQANALLEPWTTSGTAANAQESNLLGLNGPAAAGAAMGNFQSSPGYGYAVQQGLQAVDAGAASRGMLTSGQTIKAEQTLGNNLANQSFQQYYNNLNALSTAGQNSATGQATTDTSAASAQSSIYGNAVGGIGSSIGTALTNPAVQNGLAGLFSSGSTTNAANQINTGQSITQATTPVSYGPYIGGG
jgi:hypothetical protein